jgi:hypothetical protein
MAEIARILPPVPEVAALTPLKRVAAKRIARAWLCACLNSVARLSFPFASQCHWIMILVATSSDTVSGARVFAPGTRLCIQPNEYGLSVEAESAAAAVVAAVATGQSAAGSLAAPSAAAEPWTASIGFPRERLAVCGSAQACVAVAVASSSKMARPQLQAALQPLLAIADLLDRVGGLTS